MQQPESPGSCDVASPTLVTRVTASAFGRCLLEREFADQDAVSIGEASEATIVVPGEIGAHSLLAGGELNPGPFAGEVVGAGGRRVVEAFGDPLVLQHGDQANLQLVDYPHVQVVLRRELPLAVLLPAPIGLRDLFPVLTYGLTAAMLLAAIATSVVLVSEVQGIEASNDIARAMYNLDPRSEPTIVSFEPVREVPSRESEVRQIPEPTVLAGGGDLPEDAGVGLLKGEVERPHARQEVEQSPEPGNNTDVEVEAADVLGKEVVDVADSGPPLLLAIAGKPRGDIPLGMDRTEVAVVVEGASDPPRSFKENELPTVKQPSHKAIMDASPGTSRTPTPVVCDDPTVDPKSQVDVVFVIDVSTTMKFMFAELDRGMAEFDAQVRAQTTGDLHYGLVVFVDDVLVTGLGQPYTDVAELRKELAHWRRFTASNRQINRSQKNTDWPENSLDALHAAASGFSWRPHADTLRLIVHATDDDFREAPSVQSGVAVQHSYHDVVGRLQSERIRVASFAARIGGECECLDVKPGWFGPYKGQASIPEATAGAVFDIATVARGELRFAEAVSATILSNLCHPYPFLDLLE